jgi:Holliday junction resolvase RusA-like endonuclease
MTSEIVFTILGQAASKANSRRLVSLHGMARSIKSKAALDFERDALQQIPPKARARLQGPIAITMAIYYASERPDLDESIVLDVLQDRYGKKHPTQDARPLLQAGVYRNDRQIVEKHVYKRQDKANPRVVLMVRALEPQQPELPMPSKTREKKPRTLALAEVVG